MLINRIMDKYESFILRRLEISGGYPYSKRVFPDILLIMFFLVEGQSIPGRNASIDVEGNVLGHFECVVFLVLSPIVCFIGLKCENLDRSSLYIGCAFKNGRGSLELNVGIFD